MDKQSQYSGFTLVELSIALVIIGLIVGGILTGHQLILAAEQRRVISEFQGYVTAVNTFKARFNAIPGDMLRAEDWWGSMTNCGVASPSGNGEQTRNGNGDRQLWEANNPSETGEIFTFWQQLVNAELISGYYTGISGPASSWDVVLGENSPRTGDYGWSTGTWSNIPSTDPCCYQINYGNFLLVGNEVTGTWNQDPFLSPESAQNIDEKIDDGLPARGKVIALFWNDQCAAATDGGHADDDFGATYKILDDSIQCSLIFKKAF